MAILRSGGSAVDAVEMAIMTLENLEITNSGYGSNLTMDGRAECDASIIDHLGRSGAVGAVEREFSCNVYLPTPKEPADSRLDFRDSRG